MARISGRQQWLGLACWLAITFVAAAIGSAANMSAPEFYAQLQQPAWAPPAAVFGPVWTLLYLAMAIAAWLVWRINGFRAARGALTLYLAQLVLNSLWTWMFFGWHLGGGAFALIVALWALIVATLIAFWRRQPLAGWMLVPYIAWVSFAAALNFAVWQMNPQLLG